MIVYHSNMDTDIDKWDNISTTEPEKDTDDWFWGYYEFEVKSFYDLVTQFTEEQWEGMEGIEEVFMKLAQEIETNP